MLGMGLSSTLIRQFLANSVLSNADYFGADGQTTSWYTSTQFNALYAPAVNKTFVAQEAFFPPPSKRFSRVRSFDHTTGKWGRAIATGAESFMQDDDHGCPSIALNADGRIVVCWGNHDGNFHLACSTNPYDETSWVAAADLVGAYAYPHLVLLPDNSMVVMLRKNFAVGTGGFTNGAKVLVYRSLTFSGSTITVGAEVTIGDLGDDSRWYQGNAYLRPDGYVHQVCTRANFNDDVRLNAYYYRIDFANQRFLSITDVAVAFPITQTNMTNTFKVYSTGAGNTSNTPALAFDTSNRVHLMTHEGGTTDGGGGNAAPQDVKYLIGTPGVGFTAPAIIGASTQRYNSECIIPYNDGRMRAIWHKDKNNLNLRGGAVQYRELPASGGTSDFGPEITLMDHDVANSRPALSASVAVNNANAEIRALWCEVAPSSTDAYATEKHLYAWGDGGLKKNTKPSFIIPTTFTGDGFFLDLHNSNTVFKDTGMTLNAGVGEEILKITDGRGGGNILTGTAGTSPLLETIGGQLCLRYGGQSVGARYITGPSKAWTNGGFMCTTIIRHWQPTTTSLNVVSMDAGTGNVRLATPLNVNGRQIRATSFNSTTSVVPGTGALAAPYANDYIVQSYTVGNVLNLYVNGVFQQSLSMAGPVNTGSVILRLGATAAPTAASFYMGVIFGMVLRQGEQTTQMRDDDYQWALTQLPL
jgi:hypothetical protein